VSKSTAASEQATPTSAILLVFCAGFLFSCLDSSAKYLVLSGLPATFISWVRFAVHVVLVLLLFRSWANPAMFRVKSLPMQVLRGVFLFGSTIFNFAALRTLQLAETTSIYFFAPMVITALAGPLLGEWAGWRRWMAIQRRQPDRPCLRHLLDDQLLPLCHHDPAHGRDRDGREPDLLFGAGAGGADASGRALHRGSAG